MLTSDAIEAIEKPYPPLPYSLSRHILEHLRKLTSHEPVIGIMGKSGAGKLWLIKADDRARSVDEHSGRHILHRGHQQVLFVVTQADKTEPCL